MVYESAGMLASLLGCSAEAMVMDDDMLGAIRRVARGIEVSDETLAVDVIREVAEGPGHFLGHPQTMELMETEFVYPRQADRRAPDEWADAGAQDARERAAKTAREILAAPPAALIGGDADAAIRSAFPIALPPVWTGDA